MIMVRIVELKEADKSVLDAVVRIHLETFQGFFLTFMGKGFLKQLYRSYCDHPESGLLVALDERDTPVGFLAYSGALSDLYKYMIKRRLIPFGWYAAGAFFRKPRVFMRLLRAFQKPGESKREEAYVELASIGVSPEVKGTGVGSQLIDALKERVDMDRYAYINLETDALDNEAVNHFYLKNGFTVARNFTTAEGREMYEFRFGKGVHSLKRILVIGAGFLQRYVICKAKEMGYYTLAVDGNPNAVGFADADEYAVIDIVDQKAVCAYAREQKVDGVLTAATDYGVLSAAYTARELGLPGIDYEVACRIKNKYQVRQCLFAAKADDSGPSCQVSEDTDLAQLMTQITYPVMVKPCDGSGSRGAAKVEDPGQFAEICRMAMGESLTGKATVEPFVVGKEYGVESFVENGNIHVMAVMRKWMTEPPYYAELGHALPSGLSPEVEQKVRCCVEKAIAALGIRIGSVNMDVLLTEQGTVHIVDIGARMGGNLIGSHIIPLGTGVDYMANMIRAAVGDPCDFTVGNHCAVATRLLALTPGTVKELPDWQQYDASDVIIAHHLAEGDTIHEYHTNLDGCGYVVCLAGTAQEAAEKAEDIKNQIDRSIVRI